MTTQNNDHTPEPWIARGDLPEVSENYREDRNIVTADFDEEARTGSIVAVLRGHGFRLRANAAIITAAPTNARLVAACREILWPGGNRETEWSADHVEALAELLDPDAEAQARPGTPAHPAADSRADQPGGIGEKPRHESTTQKGLFFWADSIEIRGQRTCFHVVAQAEGYEGTEAHDDWFANWKDADEIAQMLARGEAI